MGGRRWIATIAAVGVGFVCAAGPSAASGYIYWANASKDIARANPDGSGKKLDFIKDAGTSIEGVEVDANYVYWTDFTAGKIGRANLDGTGVNKDFITGATFPQDVTVDSGHIYWTNQGSIGRADLNGTSVDQTFIPSQNQPQGIAVDGTYIYWASFPPPQPPDAIGRANLNGTGVDPSFIPGPSPSYVAVDPGHIYWTNKYLNDHPVGRANVNGTGVDQEFIDIPTTPCCGPQPTGITVLGGYIYWGDTKDGSIARANIDGTAVTRPSSPGRARLGSPPTCTRSPTQRSRRVRRV
jgi:Low-density lipoprotein receptor repeat class B